MSSEQMLNIYKLSTATKYIPKIQRAVKIMAFTLLGLNAFLNLIDFFCTVNLPIKNHERIRWDRKSYWYYPWGDSVVHKGIDLFGDLQTEIISGVGGVVIESGYNSKGGNHIYILSYDLKIYYYAHLSKRGVTNFEFVTKNKIIGLMGDSGNAQFTPAHLHYSIFSIVPMLRYLDLKSIKGWQKMFYLNPEKYIALEK